MTVVIKRSPLDQEGSFFSLFCLGGLAIGCLDAKFKYLFFRVVRLLYVYIGRKFDENKRRNRTVGAGVQVEALGSSIGRITLETLANRDNHDGLLRCA